MGEYEGEHTAASGQKRAAKAKLVARGRGRYDVVLTFLQRSRGSERARLELDGRRLDGGVWVRGQALGVEWKGALSGQRLVVASSGQESACFRLRRAERHSPTEGQAPPEGAVVLLPFEPGRPTSLEAWTNPRWKVLEDGSVLVRGGDNRTRRQFQDFRAHIEFRCPFMPTRRGQRRGNSGVFLQDRYELQVLDSFGLEPHRRGCGAFYGLLAPSCNPCLPPGRWQTFDIVFRAPRFDAQGAKTAPAVATVRLNGVTIHDGAEVPEPTRGGIGEEGQPGPLRLQDHLCPVRYRNIWVVEDDLSP
ncbi:MAG: DUF1080 domain-containing protein [Candidatus Brocadiia bacterium]